MHRSTKVLKNGGRE